MSPEAIILEQQYEEKMKMKNNKMKISISAYDVKHSFEVDDGSTWTTILDEFVSLLNTTGFYITESKIEEWALTSDARFAREISEK